jgi:hypothetical protein
VHQERQRVKALCLFYLVRKLLAVDLVVKMVMNLELLITCAAIRNR